MKITAVVGSYHGGGMVETAVDELLVAAQKQGAEVRRIDTLCLGLARHEPAHAWSDRARAKAHALGKKLATPP
jgi:hypothetical protein